MHPPGVLVIPLLPILFALQFSPASPTVQIKRCSWMYHVCRDSQGSSSYMAGKAVGRLLAFIFLCWVWNWCSESSTNNTSMTYSPGQPLPEPVQPITPPHPVLTHSPCPQNELILWKSLRDSFYTSELEVITETPSDLFEHLLQQVSDFMQSRVDFPDDPMIGEIVTSDIIPPPPPAYIQYDWHQAPPVTFGSGKPTLIPKSSDFLILQDMLLLLNKTNPSSIKILRMNLSAISGWRGQIFWH